MRALCLGFSLQSTAESLPFGRKQPPSFSLQKVSFMAQTTGHFLSLAGEVIKQSLAWGCIGATLPPSHALVPDLFLLFSIEVSLSKH